MQNPPKKSRVCQEWRGTLEFASTDTLYPAVPVRLTSAKTNKPLFGPSHTHTDRIDRRDFKRVTPYDERLNVKLGPLKLLDF